MKNITLFAVLAALTLLAAAPASAQDAPAGGGGETTYDFEDDLVTGDLVRPDGELLNVRRRGQRNSLIRIREHFIPEMLKSVENLLGVRARGRGRAHDAVRGPRQSMSAVELGSRTRQSDSAGGQTGESRRAGVTRYPQSRRRERFATARELAGSKGVRGCAGVSRKVRACHAERCSKPRGRPAPSGT